MQILSEFWVAMANGRLRLNEVLQPACSSRGSADSRRVFFLTNSTLSSPRLSLTRVIASVARRLVDMVASNHLNPINHHNLGKCLPAGYLELLSELTQ